jgi:O-antigen/teichoic acid export membrane protein
MMLYAMNEMDILMVGALLDTRSAGIYSASARLATLVAFVLNAVNVVIAPMISNLYNSDRLDELRMLVRDAGRTIFIVSVPIALLLFLLSHQFLSLFGAGFDKGQLSLKILIVGQLFNALSGSVGFLLTMTGHHREAAWAIGLGLLLGVALNFLLIPRFGLEGAAIATAISMVVWNGMLVWLVWLRLKVNMFGFVASLRARR